MDKRRWKYLRIALGLDGQFKNFVWSDFDAKASSAQVQQGLSTYIHEGKHYLVGTGEMFFQEEAARKLDLTQEIISKEWNASRLPSRKIYLKVTDAVRFKTNTSSHNAQNCCCAVDLRTRNYDLEQIQFIVYALKKAGFSRMGIYVSENEQPHIHVDNDSSKPDYESWI